MQICFVELIGPSCFDSSERGSAGHWRASEVNGSEGAVSFLQHQIETGTRLLYYGNFLRRLEQNTGSRGTLH